MSRIKNDEINVTLRVTAEQALTQIHKLTAENKGYGEEIKKRKAAIEKLKTAEGNHKEEIKQLKREVADYKTKIADNNNEIARWEKQIHRTYQSSGQLRKTLKELKSQLEATSRTLEPEKFRQLQQEISKTEKALARSKDATGGLTAAFLNLKKAEAAIKGFFTAIGMSLFNQVANGFRSAVQTIVDFERANSQLAAILGTTKEGISGLTDEARRLGATTSYSAAQVTELQIELAKLGFSPKQITDMEAGVMKFAKAVGTDLASAAAFAGASMRIFNISAENSEEMLASLAIGTTKSALDFGYLQSAMSTVGPVANAFGFSIQETIALLGSLANAGFDASTAATATRNILLNLADSSGSLATALGSPVKDLDGLAQGLKKLEEEGVDLAGALELTDKRSVAVFSTFLNNVDSLTELRDSVSGASGAFSAMSDEMGNNVQGALNTLSSTVEGVVLKFYGASGVLKSVVNGLTKLVEWLGKGIDFIDRNATAVKIAAAAFASYKVGVWLASLEIKKNAALLAAHRITMALSAAATNLFSGNIKKATQAFRVFNLALKANPYGLILSALGAVITAITIFFSKTKEAAASTEEVATATDHVAEASKRAGELYGEQRGKIEALVLVAKNETLTLAQRKKAIDELNRIVPGYNAEIDKTTGAYKASDEALNNYLQTLEKEMRFKANQEQLQKLITTAEKFRNQADDASEKLAQAQARHEKYVESLGNNPQKDVLTKLSLQTVEMANGMAEIAKKGADTADAAVKAFSERMEKRINDGSLIPQSTLDNTLTDTITKPTATAADKAFQKIKTDLAAMETELSSAHSAKQLEIDQQKPNLRATDYQKKTAAETIRYYSELIKSYEDFAATIPEEHSALLNDLEQKQTDARKKILAAEEQDRKANVAALQNDYDERLQLFADFYDDEATEVKKRMADNSITQQQGEIELKGIKLRACQAQLDVYQKYLDEVNNATDWSVDEREKKEKDLNKKIKDLNKEKLTLTGQYWEDLRNLTDKEEKKLSPKEQYKQERQALIVKFDAAIAAYKDNADAVKALEKAKYNALKKLDKDYTDNQKKENLKRKAQWAQYASQWVSLASSAVSEAKDFEISASEQKYDQLIAQAQANGQSTVALEEEKEAKTLEIKKKYAVMEFMVQIAKIGLNTAAGVMKTVADLGYPACIPMVALTIATGAVETAIAAAELAKVQSMQPSKSASSSSSKSAAESMPTASRTMTGFADGGYTGPGDRYEVAGVVHRGEYVVPKPIMADPRVIDAVGTIEAIRQHRAGISLAPASANGYANGGWVSPAQSKREEYDQWRKSVNEMIAAIKTPQKNYVTIRDIRRTEKQYDRMKQPFSK